MHKLLRMLFLIIIAAVAFGGIYRPAMALVQTERRRLGHPFMVRSSMAAHALCRGARGSALHRHHGGHGPSGHAGNAANGRNGMAAVRAHRHCLRHVCMDAVGHVRAGLHPPLSQTESLQGRNPLPSSVSMTRKTGGPKAARFARQKTRKGSRSCPISHSGLV